MKIPYHIILASKSPRRQYLLKEAGFKFTVRVIDTDETFPESLSPEKVAEFIARKKAAVYSDRIGDKELLITADTVVILEKQVLGKPVDEADAKNMLRSLSNKTHEVVTGVCLSSKSKTISFDDTTLVSFKKLTEEEINYYVRTLKPYDKAGAYGAQEWMGMVAIEKIVGSYFNVMGLPVHKLYEHLINF